MYITALVYVSVAIHYIYELCSPEQPSACKILQASTKQNTYEQASGLLIRKTLAIIPNLFVELNLGAPIAIHNVYTPGMNI